MPSVSGEQLQVVTPFPLTEFAYRCLYDWCLPVWGKIADDFTPTDPYEFMEDQLKRIMSEDVKTWGVVRGDELGGYVRFERSESQPWTGAAHAILNSHFGVERRRGPRYLK